MGYEVIYEYAGEERRIQLEPRENAGGFELYGEYDDSSGGRILRLERDGVEVPITWESRVLLIGSEIIIPFTTVES